MPEPIDVKDIAEVLPKWADGRITLKDIKGYTDDELYAIAHTGYFFLMQGKNEEARTIFEGLVAIDPRSAYYRRALGVIFHKLGDSERAIKQFGYAIQVNPNSPAAFINRAEVLLSENKLDEAAQDLQAAMDNAGPQDIALRKKARALLRRIRR